MAATLSGPALAGTVAEPDDALFFVNEPTELSFVSMSKVVEYLKDYYAKQGITKPEDVDRYYEVLRTHGAPNAGIQDALVGIVIQDAQYEGNGSGVPRAVLVIKGRFVKEKVYEMLRKHYDEHMEKTGHPADPDRFLSPDPQRPRELVTKSLPGYHFFSSGAIGDTQLLDQVVAAVTEGTLKPKGEATSTVKFHIDLSSGDKDKINGLVMKKYEEYKNSGEAVGDDLPSWRIFSRGAVKGVALHKVNFIRRSVRLMRSVDIEVERARSGSENTRKVSYTGNFMLPIRARLVKSKILSHYTKALKNASPEEVADMEQNVRITRVGGIDALGNVGSTRVRIECTLNSLEDQMGAFAITSSYIARGFVNRANERHEDPAGEVEEDVDLSAEDQLLEGGE